MNVGDQIEVTYRLSGRKWQRDPNSEVKYFLSCEALSFRKLDAGGTQPDADPNSSLDEAAFEEDDEVPF